MSYDGESDHEHEQDQKQEEHEPKRIQIRRTEPAGDIEPRDDELRQPQTD
jgi:hypothetical protein